MNVLTRLRENEPLQLIMWPVLGAAVAILVAKGVVTDDLASVIVAAAVAVLGGSGVVAARSQVTSPAHVSFAAAQAATSAVEHLRGQIADTHGQPGVEVLDYLQAMLAARAFVPRSGRHGRGETGP